MTIDKILASIDSEIAQLKQARTLLSRDKTKEAAAPIRKRRTMTAAGRKRIGDAQRKRWARQKAANK